MCVFVFWRASAVCRLQEQIVLCGELQEDMFERELWCFPFCLSDHNAVWVMRGGYVGMCWSICVSFVFTKKPIIPITFDPIKSLSNVIKNTFQIFFLF